MVRELENSMLSAQLDDDDDYLCCYDRKYFLFVCYQKGSLRPGIAQKCKVV